VPTRQDPWKDPAIARGLLGVAEVVRALRLGRGWTLEEAAERADLAVRHIQLLESGTSNPTAATLLRVARGFGVSAETLFRGATESSELRDAPEKGSATKEPPVDARAGAAVHLLRLQRDWSQSELAVRAGLSQGAVQSIESATKSPTLRTLDAVARAFDVTVRDLLAPQGLGKRSKARVARR
jgi:transcriptional regulator with XRE-family HTH domain